jgi:hypothetical protein
MFFFAFISKQQQQKNRHFIYDISMLCLGLEFEVFAIFNDLPQLPQKLVNMTKKHQNFTSPNRKHLVNLSLDSISTAPNKNITSALVTLLHWHL